MKTSLLRIGNSQGVIIPKPFLQQLGFAHEVDLELVGNAVVIRKIEPLPREGWLKASQDIAAHGDDTLVMGDFSNSNDAELVW